MGNVPSNITPQQSDLSPYLNLDAIDPKWLEAVGAPVVKTKTTSDKKGLASLVPSGSQAIAAVGLGLATFLAGRRWSRR